MPKIILFNYLRIVACLYLLLSGVLAAQAQVCNDDLTGNNWNNSWVSCRKSANPNPDRPKSHWVLYEFDQPQSIDLSYVWNANRTGESTMGIKEAIVDYTLDGTTWTSLGTFSFPKATEKATYGGFQGPDFKGVFVAKVLITVLETHGNPDCASLAEMQFNINREACYGEVDACGVCNGKGQNTWYVDLDGDGLGDAGSTVQSCEQPLGYVSNADDECDTGVVGWSVVGKIFDENGCTGCHGAGAAGGLNLTTYATAVQGGRKCGTGILTGTTLIEIITMDMYAGCGSPFIGPSMNDRVGGNIDDNELALIRKWVEDGAPEDCSCPAGSPDTDEDGFCDAIDKCPEIDNALIGTPCDDGQECTTNDVWQADCNCRGTLIDRDNDGVCDTDDLAPDNPCTADGIVDGIEPAGWVAHPDNDCDQDKISVASGDLNDFSACIDKTGTLMTAECNCGNNAVQEGGVVIDFKGMSTNEARAASGMPDGLFSGNISNNVDTLILQFPFMETGEEICLTVGFSSGNGNLRLFLNNRLMTFTGEQALNNYQPQQFCFKTLNTGVQTLTITEDGPGELRVDGSTYSSCPCGPGDISNVGCLANYPGLGWRSIQNCALEICEGQAVTLGTSRYETITFQWKGPNGLSAESPTLAFDAVKPSDSGIYWIYYQNSSGCDLIKLIELNVIAAPPVTPRIKHPACGLQNGEIVLNFTDTPGRANLEFSIDGENGNYVQVSDNLGSYVYSNLSAGKYEVWTRWDNGECPIHLGTYDLEDQPIPTVELGSNLEICEGESVTLRAEATGNNLSFKWSNDKKTITQKVTPIPDNYADQTFLYRITVTDENGCSVKDRVNVKVKSIPKVLVDLKHPTAGSSNGAVVFRFADHPDHKNLQISMDGETGEYMQIADEIGKYTMINLPRSSYDAWVRWEDGSCPVHLGLIRLQNDATCPEIAAAVSKSTICEGESVKLSVTKITGATYAWSNGATTYAQTVTPTLAGYDNETFSYSVTVTDRNGCSRVDGKTVKVNAAPQATYSLSHPHCGKADGAITFKFKDHPTQNYLEFSINGANGTYRKVADANGEFQFKALSARKYNLWVRWGNDSCPVNLGEAILQDIAGPQINAGADQDVCEGNSIRLNVNKNKNWTYLWSNGVKTSSQTLNMNPRPYEDRTLKYAVTVTDQFGCKAKDEVMVDLHSKPRATFTITKPHCGRSDGVIQFNFKDHKQRTTIEFSIDGKNGKYKLAKDNAGSLKFASLKAGTYNAWVRWGDDSCPVSLGKIVLEDIAGPQIDAGPDIVVCEGTPVRLNVNRNSNWTYSWSNGIKTPAQTLTLTPKPYENLVRTYTIRVTDKNNCRSTDDVKVTVLSKPRATATLVHPNCGKTDGAITFSFKDHVNQTYMEFSITGKEGTYVRRADNGGTYKFSKLAAGTYELWVRWRGVGCPVRVGRVQLKAPGNCNTASNIVALPEEMREETIRLEDIDLPEEPVPADNNRIRYHADAPGTDHQFTDLQVYPNPASQGSTITIRYYTEQLGEPLKIVDPTGKIIRLIDADQISKGWNEIPVDLAYLSTGSYFVVDGYGNYKVFVIIK